MAWTVKVTKDPDKENVGSVTAIWNAGLPDEFTFSARGERTSAQYAAFVAAAIAARDNYLAGKEIENEVASEITLLLNQENN